MSPAPPALELVGIRKRFGEVVANDGVDLAVAPGEIRALVGENGAGKTTLMRIAYGLERPDAGEIRVDGRVRRWVSPLEAMRAGLGMVHQRFMQFDALTVAENVVFGAEPRRAGLVDRRRAMRRVAELASAHGLEVPAAARLGSLSVGERQRVEILKMLYRGARVLILDEPTAVLGPRERRGLFDVVQHLASAGSAVVLITHKLEEVFQVAERATVLRDGRVTGTVATVESSPEDLARRMVGRPIRWQPSRASRPAGEPLLEIDGLSVRERDAMALEDVSLVVREGEIVGVAGAAGNGQRALAEAICGASGSRGGGDRVAGRVKLGGREVSGVGVAERRGAGLAYIPEERDSVGLALDARLADNLLLGREGEAPYARRGLLDPGAVDAHARGLLERFEVKAAGVGATAASLSGGNRQKLVLGRELSAGARLLLADQPTQGVDIGAAESVHRELAAFREAGGGVLLISSELAELLRLSDRIVVLYRGRIVGELDGQEATEERLGRLMAGLGTEAVG